MRRAIYILIRLCHYLNRLQANYLLFDLVHFSDC